MGCGTSFIAQYWPHIRELSNTSQLYISAFNLSWLVPSLPFVASKVHNLVKHQVPNHLHHQIFMRIDWHSALHNVKPIWIEACTDSGIARFPVFRVPTCRLPIDDLYLEQCRITCCTVYPLHQDVFWLKVPMCEECLVVMQCR